jgi:hypothetical protein
MWAVLTKPKTKKTAWVGAFLIITWYWIGSITLFLVDGFTIALMPDLSSVSAAMLRFIGVSITNPGLGLLFAFFGGISMWALEALFYIRMILLYVYLYGMPIAFALAYGNLPVISDISMGFAKRFVPLAVLPLPAAIVFKGYDLIYGGGTLTPQTAFLKFLVAVSLPLIALYITWKTFKYATPLTARVVGGATKGAALIGGVAAGAYVGGAGVATTAARWGPKAAAGKQLHRKLLIEAGTELRMVPHRTVEPRMTQVGPQPTHRVTNAEWSTTEVFSNGYRPRRSRTAYHEPVRRREPHSLPQH